MLVYHLIYSGYVRVRDCGGIHGFFRGFVSFGRVMCNDLRVLILVMKGFWCLFLTFLTDIILF